jgi:hypothetical protein
MYQVRQGRVRDVLQAGGRVSKKLRRRAVVMTGIAVLAAVAVAPRSRSAPDAESATAADHCTRPAADQILLELHLEANPGDLHPAAQVLCGAFLGAGVEAMVASVRIPSCGRTGDWLVFRYEGGWQRVFESHNGADLVAVGTGIKETQYVLRPGDAHCFPTGGTRSRVWRWNGSRFTSTAWKYSKPAAKRKAGPSRLTYFESPSHNIWCDSGDEEQAYCATKTPPHSATLNLDGTLRVCARRRCGGPGKFGAGDPVLGYGRVNEQGGFRCKSQLAGMTCTVKAGFRGAREGFRISRSGVTRVGS